MQAAVAFPFARAAAALQAYERNARDAALWADRSWFATALRVETQPLERVRHALESAGRKEVDLCSRALLRAAGVLPPEFGTLLRAGPALLDCLPAQVGLRVFRMRAVRLRRAQARRLIDKRTRTQLSEWLGMPLDHLINQGSARSGNAPDIDRFAGRAQIPSLDRLDAQALSFEGYALLMRDLRSIAPPFPLLRLALPKTIPATAWLHDDAGQLDPNGTSELFALLPKLLPEWAWLFG
jgi:type III secretion system HrpB4-like protein